MSALRVVHLDEPPWVRYELTCQWCGCGTDELVRVRHGTEWVWMCRECEGRERGR